MNTCFGRQNLPALIETCGALGPFRCANIASPRNRLVTKLSLVTDVLMHYMEKMLQMCQRLLQRLISSPPHPPCPSNYLTNYATFFSQIKRQVTTKETV